MADNSPVRVLCIGGSTRPNSSSEKAVKVSAAAAEAEGAVVDLIVSRDLMFPIYDTETPDRTPEADRFVKAARAADALIVASPGYHGSMSGMIKNVLDYLEDTNSDDRVYLDGVPVGCIAVSYGWQATVSTLQSLRTTVHALRGWPSPFGATINATEPVFGPDGACIDDRARFALETVAKQVVEFAKLRKAGLIAELGTTGTV
ncbi:MAG TPA: NADPH-dependent FMN reductase [Sporichthya sp.]|jgi:FMN reductase|nr:NADPH-dependent FMN reductase [Sporichthya sp.]